jgi:hypothetical protein
MPDHPADKILEMLWVLHIPVHWQVSPTTATCHGLGREIFGNSAAENSASKAAEKQQPSRRLLKYVRSLIAHQWIRHKRRGQRVS